MKIILGIGNPGIRYELTKHNVGFIILDKVAQKYKMQFVPSKNEFLYAGNGDDTISPFILVKPTTYVNLSGIAAAELKEFYDFEPSNELLVVYDDLHLELGKIRIRKSGGDGGHNGINSLIYHLQTDNFTRIRFGIGNNFEHGKMKDYVLDNFSNDELRELDKNFNLCADLINVFIKNGQKGMLDYYSKLNSSLNKTNLLTDP